ncbi:MAG: AMP-binding protein, partial [Saprospiraceae bacterium]|nr:AMP-binding protein [Saprospiraceae bacterium]
TTPFLHHGGYVCLLKKFDPEVVLSLLEKEQVTVFMGVPTMLKMIADVPAFEQADFSSLYYLIVGGEPMPVPLIEQWDAKGVPVRQGFGMTEVGPNLFSLHQRDALRKKGSIGRPNFYVLIRIVDPEGKEVPVDQPGELLLKGPMVTPGYWRNEVATAKTIVDGWFHSGDMLRQDAEGYLFVVDRIKNMYISGGENVYPAEIERVLVAHPAISEVAVIGVPDEKWGEVGKAFVVKNGELTEEEVLAYCRQQLARFKVPKTIAFIESLPKNDTGKIDRRALK